MGRFVAFFFRFGRIEDYLPGDDIIAGTVWDPDSDLLRKKYIRIRFSLKPDLGPKDCTLNLGPVIWN